MNSAPPVRLQEIRVEVPRAEWAGVKTGHKREFRVPGRRATTKFPAPTPTPAVAYVRGRLTSDSTLVVLERTWSERLGEIAPESLELEGCDTLAEFRRRWCARYHTRFRPLDPVRVYRLRPFTADDREWAGALLLERLYGGHL